MKIKFYKYHGTGNDFILIDNRSLFFDKSNVNFISKICNRNIGVGADGLILLENHENLDFKMIYFNSDGKETSMCGNGGRCIVSFAKKLNVIKDKAKFMAIDGPHASFIDNGLVSLQMNQVNLIDNIEGGYVLDTGSPHFVKFCNSINELDVVKKGKEIRKFKNAINSAYELLGKKIFFRNKSEKKSTIFRRSIFVCSNVSKGEKFTKENIRRIRPGNGLEPKFYEKLIGRRAKKNLQKGNPLTTKDIK